MSRRKDQMLALVRWLVDESVGVMPLSAAKADESELFVGSTTKMQWKGKKLYDVQILKTSTDSKMLNKLCDDILNDVISCEDVIQDDERVVSSTEASPVKIAAPPTKRRKGSASSRVLQMSKKAINEQILSATKKAKLLFGNPDSVRATQQLPLEDLSSSDDEISTEDHHQQGRTAELIKEIQILKRQLKENTRSVSVTKNIVANSRFESLNKSVILEKSDAQLKAQDTVQGMPAHESFTDKADTQVIPRKDYHTPLPANPKGTTPCNSKGLPGATPGRDRELPLYRDNPQYKKQQAMVELVPGYGVVLSQRQLDEAIDNSGNSPTRLVRNLMGSFFTREVLASSSALGGRTNKALDNDVIAACLRFVQSKHEVTKTVLINAINDKCANARRQRPQK